MQLTICAKPWVFSLGLALLWESEPVAGASSFGRDGGYTGPAPGPFSVRCESDLITVSNRALSLAWTLAPQGPKPLWARDEAARRNLQATSEVFQIILTNGQRYAASDLLPDGTPQVIELMAAAQASRLAARIPGRIVETALRSRDGQLRVLWRVLCGDGANYVRQEIAATALQVPCAIRETVWLDSAITDARAAGQVDGSPLVAGTFFLGAEDPHALNQVERPYRAIATWGPTNLVYGKTTRTMWPLDPNLLRPGTNEFLFRYERGPHRLDIWRMALLENGREIARDEHHGHTGTSHVRNGYSLALTRVEPAARYDLTADLSTDPDFRLPPGRRVESFGSMLLVGLEGRARCSLPRGVPLAKGETLTQSFVLGVAPPGQMRRAFLHYLERERAHPYRPYLHYNSWYDISWPGVSMNETNCLEAIRAFGENLLKPYGVVMDALVFDDGWDDPKTLWKFHAGFPNGFGPHAALCRRYNTRMGVWLSPFGGYGEAKAQRLKHGAERGFETNATGFSLAGPKYYAAFQQACVGMIRQFGVNHFKFDGIASGMYANGPGASYLLDTEAMRRLMLELRREDSELYVNLTTGSWPSPFWLRFADSVWRQGGDMGFAGKGNKQQQWITYRDQEVFRNIVGKGPLYPLNALMTQGVSWSRHGSAAHQDFDSQGFQDDVRGFFGSGTSLQELYICPQRLGPKEWRVLAEGAKWSRVRADVLVDTHWVGGDPGRLEVYGYAAWTPQRATLMLRNPNDQPQSFTLDVQSAFELPPGAPSRYVLKSPWADHAGQPALTVAAGRPTSLALKPFEILVFDAVSE